MLGTIGNLLILTAFVASIVSGLAYFTATRKPHEAASWLRAGRLSWITMVFAVIGASVILSYLIFTHQFQYNYVWSNSSMDLPARYLFSAFWAGQEGSFLLWVLFSAIVGWLAARWAKDYEPYIMSVIGLSQAFMISMIVGIDFGAFTIGSSPFMLLAERFPDAPFLQSGGIPPDGNGLNDLLQNYWMVIHPPTLFLGFATMVVPFAFAVSGLWRKQYTRWVRPALPWALSGTLILLV
jgi:cytochrome c-type biogenesis protein CcmF